MGGCRCTYKNCSLKSDGVTHMFHYPVFDKVRCHQWLISAQKLEFLNLKVSQLKNRVVCQHHFQDDNFMNFLKDKLRFDAVPSLDGPFCDSSNLAEKKPEQNVSKLYTISLEDIENEYLTFNDKKANFSVKYGDFLTNCDLMDLDSMNLANDNTQNILNNEGLEGSNNITLNNNVNRQRVATINPVLNKILDTLHTNDNNNDLRVEVTEVPLEINSRQGNVVLPNEPQIQGQENNVVVLPNEPQIQGQENNVTVLSHIPKEQPNKKSVKSKKITILDEKTIESVPVPLPFPVKLEPVSPSAILSLPSKRRNLNMNLRSLEKPSSINKVAASDLVESANIVEQVAPENNSIMQAVNAPDKVEILNFKNNDSRTDKEPIKNEKYAKTFKVSMQKTPRKSVNTVKAKKSNHSLLKNRIPPERVAAIEEKRKFNMKLRDIIASCLDKLDDEETNNYENNKAKEKLKNNLTQNVSSYLSKEPELPGIQDYTVAYLEARMKKMEDILLNKIDQNSRRIMELKTLLIPSVSKKAAHTQTAAGEELQKKHLYHEISKFLSPQANSLLYEELFINKYAQKNQVHSPAKKRKLR